MNLRVRPRPTETDACKVREIVNRASLPGNHTPNPQWVQDAIEAGKIILRRFDLVVRTKIGIFDAGYTDVLVRDEENGLLVLSEANFDKTYEILGDPPCAIPT